MNRHRCKRVWQAEAREDGRLEPQDLASFERHTASCAECAAEVAALRELVQQMSALPEPRRTDLERRRARSDLLRQANDQVMGPRRAPATWARLTAAAALAMGLSTLGLLRWHRGPADRAPKFEVADVAHAVWSVETIAATSRVTMRSGTAAFQVDHLQSDARFLVELPDGRIEVRGTRFIVEVMNGQTRSVEVLEGTVMLQLPRFEGLLRAGERWPTLEASASSSAPPPVTSAERVMPTPDTAPAASSEAASSAPSAMPRVATASVGAAQGSPPAPPALAAPPQASTSSPDGAGPRFAEAMSAFTAGDYGRADGLFAAFVRDFPRDGRAEDATFLRAQARARRGDRAGAAAIAREYLRAFPRGLRRPEAQRLAGEP